MSTASFQINGADDLMKKLKKIATMDDVKDVVKLNTSEMSREMTRNASFRGHMEGKNFVKPTGTTKRSITIGTGFKEDGFLGYAGPLTEYAYYLEFGTRYMTAQPFVRQAFYKQSFKFKNDLNRLMK